MRKKLNIFSNNSVSNFLGTLLKDYELVFTKLDKIDFNLQNSYANIIILTNSKDINLINFKNINENYLILSNLNNHSLTAYSKNNFINTPISISHLKNVIENFLQNLKIQFHDIFIKNEKMTNFKNNSFCYLTKVELEILSYLIREKETSKNFIKENILNIKSDIETNSLESHLTRIRKKMNKVKTSIKIQTKSEKLLITI